MKKLTSILTSVVLVTAVMCCSVVAYAYNRPFISTIDDTVDGGELPPAVITCDANWENAAPAQCWIDLRNHPWAKNQCKWTGRMADQCAHLRF